MNGLLWIRLTMYINYLLYVSCSLHVELSHFKLSRTFSYSIRPVNGCIESCRTELGGICNPNTLMTFDKFSFETRPVLFLSMLYRKSNTALSFYSAACYDATLKILSVMFPPLTVVLFTSMISAVPPRRFLWAISKPVPLEESFKL